MALTKSDATIIAKGTSNAAFTQLTALTLTRSGTTASAAKTSHGLSTNDKVLIQGANLNEYNGVFTITVTDANNFTYTMSADPGASAAGTAATADKVTLGTALDLTGSYDCEVFGGIQNTTTGPTAAAQIWVGTSLSSAEADYVWRQLTIADLTANAWTPLVMSPSPSTQFINFAVCRNTGQAVDCFVLATHISAV